jgi:hypothetical protein
MTKAGDYRDIQILLAVKELKSCSIIDILLYCIKNYPSFVWSYHNIRNSITRLHVDGKIKFGTKSDKIIYNHNNKEYKQGRTIKLIEYNENNNSEVINYGLFAFDL